MMWTTRTRMCLWLSEDTYNTSKPQYIASRVARRPACQHTERYTMVHIHKSWKRSQAPRIDAGDAAVLAVGECQLDSIMILDRQLYLPIAA